MRPLILDKAIRVKATGGSQGLKRVWLLLEIKDGVSAVFELKPIASPATELIEKQSPPEKLFIEGMKIFWEMDSAYYKMLSVGEHKFWLRPRMKNLITESIVS